MPRRGGRSRSPMSSSKPRLPAVQQPRPPAPPPPSKVGQPQQSQPGLFSQMASTAAGVAVGSTIGHTIGGMITGGTSGSNQPEGQVQYQPQTQQDYQYQQSQASSNNSAPCQYELQQFLHCTQSQPDITLCDAFNQVFKECKMRNGIA